MDSPTGRHRRPQRQTGFTHLEAGRAGFTLLEAVIVIAVVGVVVGIVAPSFSALDNEPENSARETAAFFRQARAQAMATTSAYRVKVVSESELRGEHARHCGDDDWTPDSRLALHFPDRTRLEGEDVEPGALLACYDSRGVADASPTLTVRRLGGGSFGVEVFLGGGVRVSPAGGGGSS